MAFLETVVGLCCRHARVVVAAYALAAIAAGLYTEQHFRMDTDSAKLISSELDWRKREARFDALFPQQSNLILVVIDGATPELAQRAQGLLAAKLGAQKKQFPVVRQPGGGPFFLQNGLLFLPRADVARTMQQMIAAQPFLGALATDPSLRGVMDSLSTALMGVEHGQAKLEQIDKPMKAFADTLGTVAKGGKAYLSWQSLVTGNRDPARLRSFIEVQPALDFDALSPGAAATDAIRATARDLHLTPDNGVRVRLTGPVPLSDEEFATLAERADLMGIVMFLAVTLTLWLVVKSLRIILCILVALFTGLSLTMALGLVTVGVFNIISIAFVALFVGLGVDFGIQFCVRYRAERYGTGDLEPALVRAGRGVGKPLALAAAATAAGFFSFLPTKYVGVAELGLIAGIGMIVAFLLSITMLPALLMLVRPRGEEAEIGFSLWWTVFFRRSEGSSSWAPPSPPWWLWRACPFLRFDFDPLHLRSPKVESVSTLFDLMKDPQTSPNTIDVLAPSVDAADKLAGRLAKLPEAGQVLTLKSFVPDDQQTKLAAISDASFLLDATINPFITKPPPTDAGTVTGFVSTAKALRDTAGSGMSVGAQDARRLADTLDRLARATPADRARATAALVPGLKTMLDEMRASLQAAPVTLKSMPALFLLWPNRPRRHAGQERGTTPWTRWRCSKRCCGSRMNSPRG